MMFPVTYPLSACGVFFLSFFLSFSFKNLTALLFDSEQRE